MTTALLRSFIDAPPLVGDLPEAAAFDGSSLVEPKNPRSLNFGQKLGHLYEDAFAVMEESTPRYEQLASKLQIQDRAGPTLGELDYLIMDHALDQRIHLELAVKFYLAVESATHHLLPGPDPRDNYFRKLEKMRRHQLMLTQTHADLLPTAFQNVEIVVKHLVHGCIFDHVHANRIATVEFSSPHGRRGKWLHARDCADYFGTDVALEIIPKPLWPVPLELLEGMELSSLRTTQDIDRCVMVRAGTEKNPYFIAPDGYPEPRT